MEFTGDKYMGFILHIKLGDFLISTNQGSSESVVASAPNVIITNS